MQKPYLGIKFIDAERIIRRGLEKNEGEIRKLKTLLFTLQSLRAQLELQFKDKQDKDYTKRFII